MKPFDFYAPTTVDEALALLNQYKDSVAPIAGGTDLTLELNERKASPAVIVDLKKLKELVLDANQLATLPESLAECDSLEAISVVENPLEGGIPRVLLDKKGLSIDQ